MASTDMIYLIGSLRNPAVPKLGQELRALGYDVFDDWHAAGPNADDEWKRYEMERGNTYKEALAGYAARHVFEFDVTHLKRCTMAVLVLPAGRSGHLEFGWILGAGKRGYVLFDHPHDDPETRWDVMYQFANDVFYDQADLIQHMKGTPHAQIPRPRTRG